MYIELPQWCSHDFVLVGGRKGLWADNLLLNERGSAVCRELVNKYIIFQTFAARIKLATKHKISNSALFEHYLLDSSAQNNTLLRDLC